MNCLLMLRPLRWANRLRAEEFCNFLGEADNLSTGKEFPRLLRIVSFIKPHYDPPEPSPKLHIIYSFCPFTPISVKLALYSGLRHNY